MTSLEKIQLELQVAAQLHAAMLANYHLKISDKVCTLAGRQCNEIALTEAKLLIDRWNSTQ